MSAATSHGAPSSKPARCHAPPPAPRRPPRGRAGRRVARRAATARERSGARASLARNPSPSGGFSTKNPTASSRPAISWWSVEDADTLAQQPRPGRRHREIDDGQQRPLARAGQRARDFEIGPGRGVDVERLAVALAQGPRQRRPLGLLRALDIEDRAGASGCFPPASARQNPPRSRRRRTPSAGARRRRLRRRRGRAASPARRAPTEFRSTRRHDKASPRRRSRAAPAAPIRRKGRPPARSTTVKAPVEISTQASP